MDCLDKKRRTLGEALQMDRFSDEAIAFVNGATGKPAKKIVPASGAADNSPITDNTSTKSNGVLTEAPRESPPLTTGTVSMTFRLPSELSTRLMRVSVERKLRRERPFSQQDILAEALAQWLEKNS